jgi:hypothetical protein
VALCLVWTVPISNVPRRLVSLVCVCLCVRARVSLCVVFVYVRTYLCVLFKMFLFLSRTLSNSLELSRTLYSVVRHTHVVTVFPLCTCLSSFTLLSTHTHPSSYSPCYSHGVHLSLSLLSLSPLSLSLQSLKRAIEIDPTDTDSLCVYARFLQKCSRLRRAEYWYLRLVHACVGVCLAMRSQSTVGRTVPRVGELLEKLLCGVLFRVALWTVEALVFI